MDVPNFEREFRKFSDVVYPRFGDGRFKSFRDGAARAWEGYKPRVREAALSKLSPQDWAESDVGSGRILKQMIAAIEIGGDDQHRNNLVSWEGRYGPASAAHAPLLNALADPKRRSRYERLFVDAFRPNADPGGCFERLRDLAGDGYRLAAYIFFLIDIDRFAPIAPRTFDEAFRRLGIDLITSGRCSWENYATYNAAIEGVRAMLVAKPGLGDARHIDAHSFLWMLVRMEEAQPGAGSAPGIVRYAGARRRSIVTMADNAVATARYSNGQQVWATKKNKDLLHERERLERIIEGLIDLQEGRCALTGLPLQWHGESEDPAMLASLDRIDSNSHYVEGNLQVVCRFANQWKSNSPDGEFRRLLAIVRFLD